MFYYVLWYIYIISVVGIILLSIANFVNFSQKWISILLNHNKNLFNSYHVLNNVLVLKNKGKQYREAATVALETSLSLTLQIHSL